MPIPNFADLIRSALGSELFAGGFVLTMLGAMLALCRSLPGRATRLVRRQLVVSAEVRDTDPSFEWTTAWLAQHPSMQGARTLTVTSKAGRARGGQGSAPICADTSSRDADKSPEITFAPAPGIYLLWERGRPVLLVRERKEGSEGMGSLMPPRDTYRLHAFGRRPDFLRSILERAAAAAHQPETRRVGIWSLTYENWRIVTHVRARTLGSVHLAEGQARWPGTTGWTCTWRAWPTRA